MGKRKRHRKEIDTDELYRKIRRLERHIERQRDRYNNSDEYDDSDRPEIYSRSEEDCYSDSECSNKERETIPSAVTVPTGNLVADKESCQPIDETTGGTSQEPDIAPEELPAEILEALGESREKDEVFGPKIKEEISKRWGKIICEGLNKDKRQNLLESIHIPENFQLLKAPKLNPEISAVCSDPGRKRDKRLEKAQNHLGLGIAALTNLMSDLIEGDIEKTDLIKRLSETGQVLLDLHYQNTLSRRKLTSYCLGKNFHNIVDNAKRDTFLFGDNLGEKIKAAKTAERSGLQIKAPEPQPSTSYRSNSGARQGNARGPPRQQVPRNVSRTGGHRTRYTTQTPRYRRTTNDRYTSSSKTNNSKSTKKGH